MNFVRLPFEAVFADESGGNLKTPQSDYLTTGTFPIVDQGKALIGGYVNDPSRICGDGRSAIVFGDHTRCIKFIDFPFCMGADGVKVLRPKIAADLKYLYYYLLTLKLPDAGYDRHYKYLKRTELVLPPLQEQRRIAAILDQTDALRAKRREALAQLGELQRSIFIETFGDPVANPKAWPRVSFDEACPTRLGKMLDQKQQTGQHLKPYLRNANVQWFRFDLNDVLEMDFEAKIREMFRLEDGDLLICEGGEPGRAAIWRGEIAECYYQKALHRGRPNPRLATSEYLAWLLWFLAARGGLADHVTSATIAHLTGEKLKAINIPLPPLDLQCLFVQRLNEISKLRTSIETASLELDNLFTSLQHRAFAGEL